MAAEAQSTTEPGLRISEASVSELTWRELGARARTLARARVVFFPVLASLTLILVLLDPEPWRVWLYTVATVVTTLILIRDFLWLRQRSITPSLVLYVLGVVVVFQAVIIAITGGAESPILIIYVAMGIVPSLVIGRFRLFLLYVLLPAGIVWFYSIGSVTGLLPDLIPSYWRDSATFGRDPFYTYLRAFIITGGMMLGGTIGVMVRAALGRSVRTAMAMRRELVETMRERNRELLNLSGELAHELKNPLASIQGLSGLIAKKLPAGSREAEQMEVLVSEVRRMGANLDEFLNFSRPVTSLACREVHPAELLADVVQLHQGLAAEQGITLDADPGDATPITCDPRKVKQVLVNLMQNALEATPRGGNIKAVTSHQPEGAAITIEDTGTGLTDEVRSHLFKPGTTTKADGSGLGLTIARAIAEQHGGSLTLENRAEGGCRATLTLPTQPRTNGSDEQEAP